ncbi:hypothetical protein FF38_04469 [Lucilia cuprina]|uniref:Uncharacterized protein n=1 Tax=Lucilia cuprina TaxID=7375 RepID=A0A0L0BXC2_LUCCU|nr:hypothetical protein FF38_04469 [Lucilia cuprina]
MSRKHLTQEMTWYFFYTNFHEKENIAKEKRIIKEKSQLNLINFFRTFFLSVGVWDQQQHQQLFIGKLLAMERRERQALRRNNLTGTRYSLLFDCLGVCVCDRIFSLFYTLVLMLCRKLHSLGNKDLVLSQTTTTIELVTVVNNVTWAIDKISLRKNVQ